VLPKGTDTSLYHQRIDQYLRLVSVKDRVAKFLLEVKKYLDKLEPIDPLRKVPR
jgi:hypothetical protein